MTQELIAKWEKPEYEVFCVLGYSYGVQQIAILEHRGRIRWKTKAIAEKHAREFTAMHGREAYVSEV